jgi:hypothetical protein
VKTDPVRRVADEVAAFPRRVWRVNAADAVDVSMCGGKAAGLATLQRAGFAVPAAVCLTTQCYRRWLEPSALAPLLASDIKAAATLDPERRRTVLATMRDPGGWRPQTCEDPAQSDVC